MDLALLATRIGLAIAVGLLLLGAVAVLRAGNAVKRLGGVLIAYLGALFAAAALHAPAAALMVGVGAMAATLMVGAALIVRLQETYSSVERDELDMADAMSEPVEPGA